MFWSLAILIQFIVVVSPSPAWQIGSQLSTYQCYKKIQTKSKLNKDQAEWNRTTKNDNCIFNPLGCWIIVSYEPTFKEKTDSTSYHVYGAPDSKLLTVAEVKNWYNILIDTATKLGNFQLKFKFEAEKIERIKQFEYWHSNGVQSLCTTATAQGQDQTFERAIFGHLGSADCDLYISIEEEYVGCGVTDLVSIEVKNDPDYALVKAIATEIIEMPPPPTPSLIMYLVVVTIIIIVVVVYGLCSTNHSFIKRWYLKNKYSNRVRFQR